MELCLERGDRVCGIARNPETSKEISFKYKDQIHLVKGDVNDKELGNKILKEYPWKEIDLLINNAGIYVADSWENFEQTFLTNSIAPYCLTRELFSLLRKSSHPCAAFITSQMGSVTENHSGGAVSYRASKAALNMMVKCLSLDEKWLTSLLFHPGWVKTNMGGENAPTERDESAEGILRLIDSSNQENSGTFRNFKGQTLPW
jgi:NAD(P)-dependent dehydrogenase (short-subunit alcohol dehydrogenase family)